MNFSLKINEYKRVQDFDSLRKIFTNKIDLGIRRIKAIKQMKGLY